MKIINRIKAWWKEVRETEPLVFVWFECQGDISCKQILVSGYRDPSGMVVLTPHALGLIDKTKQEIYAAEHQEAVKIAAELGGQRSSY